MERQTPDPIRTQPVFQAPTQSPEQLYRQALQLANSGENSGALRALEDIILRFPTYAVAHNDLGVLYQQEGDLSQARRHHEEALRLEPGNLNFQKNLADFLNIACGETETALELYVKILGANPRDIETLKAISQICVETGKREDARSFLETILKIEPWNREARTSLDTLAATNSVAARGIDEMHAEILQLVQQERLSEAHSLLEELVHNNSNNALLYNDLGVLRFRLGDIEGARCAYERAAELQPANSNFRKNLADLYFVNLGMVDDAIRIYLDLYRLQPRDLETLAALGQICVSVGRPEEAKSFYRRALEIEPWSKDIRTALQELA